MSGMRFLIATFSPVSQEIFPFQVGFFFSWKQNLVPHSVILIWYLHPLLPQDEVENTFQKRRRDDFLSIFARTRLEVF